MLNYETVDKINGKIIRGFFMRNLLDRNFYNRDTSEVAEDLLGKALVKYDGTGMAGGIIVETEAYYGGDDPASHAYPGKTPRSEIMFGKPGLAYVYLCYGMYYLLNIVTEREGEPGAVLLRALAPVWGIDVMKSRRRTDINLTNGPGRLTMALGIDIKDNGADIVKGERGFYIFNFKKRDNNHRIIKTGRIGIKKGKERLLRFLMVDDGM